MTMITEDDFKARRVAGYRAVVTVSEDADNSEGEYELRVRRSVNGHIQVDRYTYAELVILRDVIDRFLSEVKR